MKAWQLTCCFSWRRLFFLLRSAHVPLPRSFLLPPYEYNCEFVLKTNKKEVSNRIWQNVYAVVLTHIVCQFALYCHWMHSVYHSPQYGLANKEDEGNTLYTKGNKDTHKSTNSDRKNAHKISYWSDCLLVSVVLLAHSVQTECEHKIFTSMCQFLSLHAFNFIARQNLHNNDSFNYCSEANAQKRTKFV